MGGRAGYEYRYWFWMVDEHEINSLHKLNLLDGVIKRLFLFEIRTNFVLKTRAEEEGVADDDDVIMDSETFDAYTLPRGDERREAPLLDYSTEYRLREYWMTEDEIDSFVADAVAFANQMAAKPENASLNIVPVVVRLDVCTVQQEGESFDAAMERAIRAHYLVPLYLWPRPTAVERRPLTPMHMMFLRELERIRVEDVGHGLARMRTCHICSQRPSVGAQISSLPHCNHTFHSHCIVRWLEDSNLCPLCHYPAYSPYITVGPPFERSGA